MFPKLIAQSTVSKSDSITAYLTPVVEHYNGRPTILSALHSHY